MAISENRTSAEIQREIDEERNRLGDRIDAIQERMSPGQMIDEALLYARKSGGAEYMRNLGQAMKTNPLPVAMIGVGMAWLMSTGGGKPTEADATPETDNYPLYRVEGGLRRVGPPEGDGESRFSHFVDDAGRRFKAATNAAGDRAGHFVDEAGETYRGFVDASGRGLDRILDETGSALDAASGWTSHSWRQVTEAGEHVRERAFEMAGAAAQGAASAGSAVRRQSGELNDVIVRLFRDQPLVGGALAFAAGAAIGAALPSTDAEMKLWAKLPTRPRGRPQKRHPRC